LFGLCHGEAGSTEGQKKNIEKRFLEEWMADEG